MSKRIIFGHRDRGYLELFKKMLIQNGLLSSNITLVHSSQELVASCNEKSYDIVIISDSLNLGRRFEVVANNPFISDAVKLILLANSRSVLNYKGVFWANASIIDYQSENITTILNVLSAPIEQVYLSPSLIQKISRKRTTKYKHSQLSESDLDVLRFVCADLPSEEIARRLKKSKRTIDGQRLKLKQVLGVRGMAGLIYFALENGIYNPDKY